MATKQFVDEIPPASGREYKIKTLANGNSQIEDVTVYQQQGSAFGSKELNEICVIDCDYSFDRNVHNITTPNKNAKILSFTPEYPFFPNSNQKFKINGEEKILTANLSGELPFGADRKIIGTVKGNEFTVLNSPALVPVTIGIVPFGIYKQVMGVFKRDFVFDSSNLRQALTKGITDFGAFPQFWARVTKLSTAQDINEAKFWMTGQTSLANGKDYQSIFGNYESSADGFPLVVNYVGQTQISLKGFYTKGKNYSVEVKIGKTSGANDELIINEVTV